MSDASLRALAEEARSAVRRAAAVRQGAEEQRVFSRMHEEVSQYSVRTASAEFCLQAPELALEETERESLVAAVSAARGTTGTLREKLAEAPDDVRAGSTWKAFKESLVAVERRGDEVRTTAFDRLRESHPKPIPGLVNSLPPNDGRRSRYASLEQQYASIDATSTEDLRKFFAVTGLLDALQEEIQASSVPDEHRGAWRALVDGTLTVDRLNPAFLRWLGESGHGTQIVLSFRG